MTASTTTATAGSTGTPGPSRRPMSGITHADGSITWSATCACGDRARGKTLPGQPLPDHPQCPTCAIWWPIAEEPCD
ncbi:MAG: hypothetical protein IT337_01925, partial [Thermomicrobiales bacterium]|nr:hypothetical protein [Thermomicrobiales bacterium]